MRVFSDVSLQNTVVGLFLKMKSIHEVCILTTMTDVGCSFKTPAMAECENVLRESSHDCLPRMTCREMCIVGNTLILNPRLSFVGILKYRKMDYGDVVCPVLN